jgi:predicted GNAT family N-acyltransferase
MKNRNCALDLDMLSMYGQDDLRLSVFVVEQMPAVMELANHFLPVVLECW